MSWYSFKGVRNFWKSTCKAVYLFKKQKSVYSERNETSHNEHLEGIKGGRQHKVIGKIRTGARVVKWRSFKGLMQHSYSRVLMRNIAAALNHQISASIRMGRKQLPAKDKSLYLL